MPVGWPQIEGQHGKLEGHDGDRRRRRRLIQALHLRICLHSDVRFTNTVAFESEVGIRQCRPKCRPTWPQGRQNFADLVNPHKAYQNKFTLLNKTSIIFAKWGHNGSCYRIYQMTGRNTSFQNCLWKCFIVLLYWIIVNKNIEFEIASKNIQRLWKKHKCTNISRQTKTWEIWTLQSSVHINYYNKIHSEYDLQLYTCILKIYSILTNCIHVLFFQNCLCQWKDGCDAPLIWGL